MKLFNTSKVFIVAGLVLGLVAAWTCSTATEMKTIVTKNSFGGTTPPGWGDTTAPGNTWHVNCYKCNHHKEQVCPNKSGYTCIPKGFTLEGASDLTHTSYGSDTWCQSSSSNCGNQGAIWCDTAS